jgi:hypothetical protein
VGERAPDRLLAARRDALRDARLHDALAPLLVLTALLVAGGLPVLVALAALVARYRRRAPASPAWGT